MPCLITKREEWTTRLLVEHHSSNYSYFLTLTYSDENLCWGYDSPTLSLKDLQNFIKRLRKSINFKIRYYGVGEYGSHTDRPHYHVIVFSPKALSVEQFKKAWTIDSNFLGNLMVLPVSIQALRYVAKNHLINDKTVAGRTSPFSVMSRRPGIGNQYVVEKFIKWHQDDLDRYFLVIDGQKRPLPKYLQKRVYSSDQRIAYRQKLLSEQLPDTIQSIRGYDNYLQSLTRNELMNKKSKL